MRSQAPVAATAVATIQLPNGLWTDVLLVDDGAGGDSLAADRTYSGRFAVPVIDGVFQVTMTASPTEVGGSAPHRKHQDVSVGAEEPAPSRGQERPRVATGGIVPTRSIRLNFTAIARPDLEVLAGDLTVSPTLPRLGTPTTLMVVVRNNGLTQADSVQVVLSDETINASIGAGHLTITGGDAATFATSWTAIVVGEHRIRVRISLPGGVLEGNPANNQAEFVVPVLGSDPTTGVEATLPTQFGLGPPKPNPFRGAVGFFLALPHAARVQLIVYDVRGRLVKRLIDGKLPAGRHTSYWNGTDDHGAVVGSSVYFVRFSTPGVDLTRKTVLIR